MPEQEKEFLGGRRSKMQTYLILGIVLIVAIVVGNLAFNNPDTAKDGVKSLLGLPSWALAAILVAVGSLIFWLGLKMETDWPEAVGAFAIAGGVALGEAMVGWNTFALGGVFILPYLIPAVLFLVLLFYGMQTSK